VLRVIKIFLKPTVMKKVILLFLLVLIFALPSIISSCRHELPLSCADVKFKITVTKTDAVLNNANGSITATATGGEDFKFSLNGGPLKDSGYFGGLEPFKEYRVVGRNSMGCTDTALVTVGSIDPCNGVTVLVSGTKTDADANQSNGTITAAATGGSKFKFSLNGGSFQDSATFSNLAAGKYTIAARSEAGCLGTTEITIGTIDPCAGVTVAITTTQVNPSVGQSNGSITATATGGTGFTYSINNGTFQSGGNFSNLAAGTYTITAKNASSCNANTQVTLTATDPCNGVTIAVSTTEVNPAAGQSTGSITATATGGSGFSYSVNNGAYQASGVFANLPAGTYLITAKNSNGCLGTKQVTLVGTDPCAGVTVAVTTTQVNPGAGQSNGSITASATGGNGFTYSLNGAAYQGSGAFTGLAAGNYTVTAKNANGCTGSTIVALGASNPCAGITVVVSTTQVNPSLNQSDGSITASATGGSGFTYSLNNGAFQASGTFSGLAAGSYTITAKNSNGCLGTSQSTLTGTDPCAGITVAVTSTQVNPGLNQSNGSISASATGGTGFTYSLNNGAFQASGNFTGLAAGNYTITAKNANGCLGTKLVTLTSTDPCAGITVAVTTTQVSPATGQSNGSITASATGGTGFTYSLNGGTYQAGSTFSGLAAGNYTISAKNSNGCTGSTQVTLTAGNACASVNITLTFTIVNTTPCISPANNGSITVSASGSSGYTYNINGGAYQAGNVFSAQNAGNYLVGVKDANGCTKTQTATIGIVPQGPTFAPVRTLISARCSGSGCHMNGGSASGYNFDTDCNVVKYWSQINGACVTGALKKMPISPQPALTAAEKATITAWVNAGHLYTN
jgi:large repetitive protein